MNVLDCIKTRRSIRKYKDKQVPWDDIVNILQAGRMAPSAGNILNWKFIVVKDDGKRKAIAEACSQQWWMEQAPIHIVVVAEPEKCERFYGARGRRFYTLQNVAAAVENMLLAANSLGLGSCWVGAFDEDALRTILILPEQVDVHAVITIGYADEKPQLPPRPRIEHVIYFEKWWGRMETPKTYLGWWSVANEKYARDGAKLAKKHGKKIKDKIKEKVKKEIEKRKKKKK